MNLKVEQLESKILPAVSVNLVNGTLRIIGDNTANTVYVSLLNQNQISVVADGVTSMFLAANVNSIFADLRNGNDYFKNDTSVNDSIFAGNNDDYVEPGFGNSTVFAGRGNDIVTKFPKTGNLFVSAGTGSDNVWGGLGIDTVDFTDSNRSLFYGIVGGQKTVFADNNSVDVIAARTTDIVTNDDNDNLILFGARDGGPLVLDNGVLYLTATNNDDTAIFYDLGNQLVVNFNNQVFSYNKSDVKFIGALLLGGNDKFFNFSTTSVIAYGQAGSDVMLSRGDYTLMKSGSESDVVIGLGRFNDLSGDQDADFIYSINNVADVIRVDAADQFFVDNARDIVVGLVDGFGNPRRIL